MSHTQGAIVEHAGEPAEEHEPEELSPDLQETLNALADASKNPLPRSRIRESSLGYWRVKPVR